ncbi:MAG TPA: hypothetical protein VLU73_10570, partial [Methylococcaceae bacterium]|nr:hypothetical protein [Methylococcaceae bacterium]
LTDLKIATSFAGWRLSAELLLAVLQDGTYRKHVESLRHRLAAAMSRAGARLRDVGLTPWLEPRAGLFLWCELPNSLDAADIARRAIAENIVLAPGNVFSPARTAGRFLRFNVAQCDRSYESPSHGGRHPQSAFFACPVPGLLPSRWHIA